MLFAIQRGGKRERKREVNRAKKVTHAVTFFLPLPKEPLWIAREREREREKLEVGLLLL